ncbi:MAG: PAS domain S-box protein [Acidobacteria bacterium]|nr:PAS domain S-box protein [Acidobacteriota bacterium]
MARRSTAGGQALNRAIPVLPDALAGVLDNSIAGLYVFQHGKFTYANKRLAEMLGYPVEEMPGLSPIDFTHPDDRARVTEMIRQRIQGELDWTQYVFRAVRKDGSTFAAQVKGHRVTYEGEPAIAGILLDVTAEQELERALRESELKYRTLVENTIDGISVTTEGTIIFANNTYARIFGYETAADVLDLSAVTLIVPEDRARFARARQDLESGITDAVRIEVRGLHRSGPPLDLDIRGRLISYGGRRGILASVRDITQSRRKLMEFKTISEIGQSMNQSKDLQQLLSLIHQQVASHMAATNFYVALLDVAKQEVSFPYFVDEEDANPGPRRARRGLTEYVIRRRRAFMWSPQKAKELQEAGELEVIGTTPSSWLGVPLQHYDRAVGAMVVQTYDREEVYSEADLQLLEAIASPVALAIERQMAADALAASASKYRALFETANDAILMLRDELIVDCNTKATAMFGCDRGQIIGRTLVDFSPPAQPDGQPSKIRVSELCARGLAGEPLSLSWKHKRPDGSLFDARVHLSRLDLAGQSFLQAIVRDVTDQLAAIQEQNRLRDQLAQVQKMEAIGTLAGGIAHDFNNLLGGIIGYTSLVKMQIHEGHPLYRAIDTIEKSANRAAELTSQLLGFARGGRYQVQPTDLNQVVDRVLTLITRTFDRCITIQTDLDSGLKAVEADSGQLEHSLLNLCLNARDAMSAGGTLRIETSNIVLDQQEAGRHLGAAPGEHVVLTVTDTGIGMDAETQSRIFEPFFTTKEKGKGTGMGLAMVYGIFKNHGGWITVQSEVGKGSAFRLYLPSTRRSIAGRMTSASEEMPHGSGRVLVVDDEEIVRDMARTIVSELGYEVMVAPDGEAACAIYGREKIDLVILDVIMPGLSGLETFKQIRAIDKRARILVSSGYSIDGQPNELIQSGARGFIQKPYTMNAMAVAIRDAMKSEDR